MSSEACQPSVASFVIVTHMWKDCCLFCYIVQYNIPILEFIHKKKSEIPADYGVQLIKFVYFVIPLCILC